MAIIYPEFVNTVNKIKLRDMQSDDYLTALADEEARLKEKNDRIKRLIDAEKYTGIVSTGVVKRMRKAVTLLCQSTQKKFIHNTVTGHKQLFHLGFVTLTVPAHENVDAKRAQKELLEPMIRWLRSSKKMNSYIWKAELQSRGQLHYHLTLDVFVHYSELRNKWNQLLTKGGFNKEYFEAHGHDDANSTDIHAVYEVRNMEAYLTKYLSKDTQNDLRINGKVWDCSQNLKLFKYFTTPACHITTEALMKAVDEGKGIIRHEEHYSIIMLNDSKIYDYLPDNVREEMRVHLWNVRNYNRISENVLTLDCTKNRSLCTEERTLTVLKLVQSPPPVPNLFAPQQKEKPAQTLIGFSEMW